MHIDGEWLLCDDGIERPIIHGELQAADGRWLPLPFLADSGADRTLLSADTLAALALPVNSTADRLGGVGGMVSSVELETTLRLYQAHGSEVTFRGQFAAATEPEALDMSVLGREITDLFALIVDKPGNTVCLLGQRHRYVIVEE
jgi:hypothetical protein